jgi:hypothetical protein
VSPGGSVGFAAAGLFNVLVALLILGGIAFTIYSAIKAYQGGKRRRLAIDATVAANHLGHLDEAPERVTYFSSPPFGTGDSRRARDLVWGTLGGRPFETFAYSYETHTTDSEGHRTTTTHRFQITWVPLPGPVATVRITSDNALLRGLTHLGARDLEVESHEFNQKWKVWFEDERAAHAIFTPRVIERFLQPDVGGRAFTFEGSALVGISPQVSDLGDLQLVVGALNSIVDLIPPFVFDSTSGGQPEGRGEAVQ